MSDGWLLRAVELLKDGTSATRGWYVHEPDVDDAIDLLRRWWTLAPVVETVCPVPNAIFVELGLAQGDIAVLDPGLGIPATRYGPIREGDVRDGWAIRVSRDIRRDGRPIHFWYARIKDAGAAVLAVRDLMKLGPDVSIETVHPVPRETFEMLGVAEGDAKPI